MWLHIFGQAQVKWSIKDIRLLYGKNKGLLCVFVLTACAVCILRLSVGVGEVEVRGARSSAAGFIPGCVSAGERPPLPELYLTDWEMRAPERALVLSQVQPHPPSAPATHTLSLKINKITMCERAAKRENFCICTHYRWVSQVWSKHSGSQSGSDGGFSLSGQELNFWKLMRFGCKGINLNFNPIIFNRIIQGYIGIYLHFINY